LDVLWLTNSLVHSIYRRMARVDGKRNGDSNLTADRRHYYSSSQGPFYNANNIYLFYGGGDRGAMVDSITHNLRSGKRLTRVEGEPGSGKTMMSLVLADRLNRHFNIIRYDLAKTSRALLLRQLLIELCPSDATLLDVTRHGLTPSDVLLANAQIVVERQLRSSLQAGKPYVLMVDANERLGSEVIELLARLSSLEHLGIPAMHVIIFEPCRLTRWLNFCVTICCYSTSTAEINLLATWRTSLLTDQVAYFGPSIPLHVTPFS